VIGQTQWLDLQLRKQGLGREADITDVVLKSGWRMVSMIRDLVDSARLESRQLEMHREPVDPLQLVSDVVEGLGTAEERARIQVECPEWVPPVLADPGRLERALENLITNALKYSPADRPVVVRIGSRDGDAIVSVADQGVGIPAEDIPHLFTRFYRAETGKKAEGLGLGLYIVRLIVEAHGGRVWVESKVGKGSTFSLTLPCANGGADRAT